MSNKPKYLSLLAQFRSERNLTGQEGDLLANVGDEGLEVAEAILSGDKNKVVGETCDIVVYCENYLAMWDERVDYDSATDGISLSTGKAVVVAALSIELLGASTLRDVVVLIDLCKKSTIAMGYDFNKCMEETCKKILSRKGAWDKQKGKWVKFADDESKALWYEPDYSKCKL